MATTKEALLNLRYALGAVIEIKIALWLLANYSGGPPVWLAYFLLTTSALVTLYGVVWYWRWFAAFDLSYWYIATLTFLVGLGFCYVSNESYIALGRILLLILPVYAAWRIARWLVIRAFGVMLIAVSQLSAAWHSGKADKHP